MSTQYRLAVDELFKAAELADEARWGAEGHGHERAYQAALVPLRAELVLRWQLAATEIRRIDEERAKTMAKLEEILNNERTIPVELGASEPLMVTYKPALHTPEMETKERDLQAKGMDRITAVATILAEMLTGWDLTKAGKPVPITVPNLVALGLFYLNTIHVEILRDALPNLRKVPILKSGSSPAPAPA